ncbi:MAG: hypothetical protein ACOCRK_07435 [bacterium]
MVKSNNLTELKSTIEQNFQQGDKMTFGKTSDYGVQYTLKCTFYSVKIEPYAQYDQTLLLTVRPYKKRTYYQYRVKPREHISIWQGFFDFVNPDKVTETRSGVTITTSNIRACDKGYFEKLYNQLEPVTFYYTKDDEVNHYIIKDENIKKELEEIAEANNNTITENHFNKYMLTPRHITETFKGKYQPKLLY